MGDGSVEPEPEPEGEWKEELSGVARLLVVGGLRSEARGFSLATVVGPNHVFDRDFTRSDTAHKALCAVSVNVTVDLGSRLHAR